MKWFSYFNWIQKIPQTKNCLQCKNHSTTKKNVAEENEIKKICNFLCWCFMERKWVFNTQQRGERESEKYIYLIKNPAFLSSQGSFYALCTHTHGRVYENIAHGDFNAVLLSCCCRGNFMLHYFCVMNKFLILN